MHTREKLKNLFLDLARNHSSFGKDEHTLLQLWALVEPERITASPDGLRTQLEGLVLSGVMSKRIGLQGQPARRTAYYRLVNPPQQAESAAPAEGEEVDLRSLFRDFAATLRRHHIVSAEFKEDGTVNFERRVPEVVTLKL